MIITFDIDLQGVVTLSYSVSRYYWEFLTCLKSTARKHNSSERSSFAIGLRSFDKHSETI